MADQCAPSSPGLPAQPHQREAWWRGEALEWLWAVGFALLFGFRLFTDLDRLGLWDWDYFVSHATAAYKSVVEYAQLPLWTPFHCGGAPLFENFQSRVYSPSFLLVLLFGPNIGCRVAMWGFLVLGFEGTRRYSRSLGAGPWAARYAAVATVGNGAVLAHVSVGHFSVMPYVLWPWWLLALRKGEHDLARGALEGGLWLALTCAEGGLYPLVHGALFAAAVCGARALRGKSIRPLLSLLATGVTTLCMAAYLLVPSALHLLRSVRRPIVPEIVSVKGLVLMLLSTDLDFHRPVHFAGQCWGWHEYAAYVGPLFLALLCLPVFHAVKRRDLAVLGWLLAGLVSVGWVLGDFAPWSPWALGHKLPVLSSMRASGRGILPALFMFSIATSLSLGALGRRPWVTLALLVNLFLVTPRAVESVFVLRFTSERDDHFAQRSDIDHFLLLMLRGYSLMTDDVLRGRGALKCYEPVPVEGGARSRCSRCGEAWLEPEGRSARIIDWSPQRVTVELPDTTVPAMLLLNQNCHRGWVREDGVSVFDKDGLIATWVQPGDHRVVLRFEAPLFRWLCVLSLGSITALFVWVRWLRR
ncbi:MAG: hypothetical protein AB1714_22705 [Acidobacteriota bacterium]